VDVPLRTAQRLVREMHYAIGGPNTGTFVHGLVPRADPLTVMGIAWWLPPTRVAAETVHEDWRRVLTLTRLVIHPDVPTNGASFLLAGSVKRIERDGRWTALVTYADTRMGHTGAIYRAANWDYVGLTPPEAVYLDGDGKMVARKAGVSRTHAEMVALGCHREMSPGKHKFVKTLRARRTEGALF
jgi:hypothetical protein